MTHHEQLIKNAYRRSGPAFLGVTFQGHERPGHPDRAGVRGHVQHQGKAGAQAAGVV